MLGNPIRELADRLAEEAARAAEYRVRLELTEQAQSSLEEELAAERVRREQAELERDELRRMLEASSETAGAPEKASEEPYSTHAPPGGYGTSSREAEESLHPRSWWRRFFGLEWREETSLVEINVVYKYRAPGEAPGDETTIESKSIDLTEDELNDPTQPHGLGDLVTLASPPSSQDHEAPPQDYKVIERTLIVGQWEDKGFLVQELRFVVTDPGVYGV
jgi:hypothetical protein